ncbi:hypothetical protein LY76DRAFT_479196, partial [Colletotrichum caudatum]
SKSVFLVCNLVRSHWALMVVHMEGVNADSVDLYDSLQSYRGSREAQKLADAFFKAYLPTTPSANRKVLLAAVPQQKNAVDCGVFTLVFGFHIAGGRQIPAHVDGKVWRRVLGVLVGIAI